MVTVGTSMYLLQQLATLITGDTLQEYASGPMLVGLASMRTNALARRAMNRASVWPEGSFPSTIHSRMGKRQSGSLRFTSGDSSIAMTSGPGSSGDFSPSSCTDD
jgi:hypothetical protein